MSKGCHSFPFALNFPLLSACERSQSPMRHLETTLPPSFDSHEPSRHASAKIEYILTAKANRPGRLHRNISAQQGLSFLPLDPPSSLVPVGSKHGTTRSRVVSLRDTAPSQHLMLPTEHSVGPTPILLLEANLPSPRVLFAGEKFPLVLSLEKKPLRPEDDTPIELQSIKVSLQSTMTATVGMDNTSWTSCQTLLQLTDLRRAVTSGQKNDILSDLNNSALQHIAIPNTTPSFTTCTVRRDHLLVVAVELSLDKQSKAKVRTAPWNRSGYTDSCFCLVGNRDSHQRGDIFWHQPWPRKDV